MLHTVKGYWIGVTEGKHPAANRRPKLAPPSRFEHAKAERCGSASAMQVPVEAGGGGWEHRARSERLRRRKEQT